MTIIRRRHNRDFTTIRNDVFRDEDLALDALGLLCYLRSRPDDWNISQEHLRRRFGTGSGDARKPMGREQMQRIMRELIASGWVLREEARTGRGAFGGVEYIVLDEPEKGSPAEAENPAVASLPQSGFPTAAEASPESGFPTPGEPSTGEPESGEPESANPTAYLELDSTKGFSPLYPPASGGTRSLEEERISEQEAWTGNRPERGTERRPRPSQGCRGAVPPPVPPETAARFERLWKVYPESGRLAADRSRAVALFGELTPADQERAIHAAAVEARTRTQHRSQARALHRWFERGLWRNGAPATGDIGPTGAAPPPGTPAADPFAARNAAGMDQVRRGQWPSGCTHFVLADSDEGAAWEAYFAELDVKPRWMSLSSGLGAYMPAPFPPATEAA
ncbi:hypothetical protein ACLBX9_09690 [Methylobacterium sp. A49B]